jgi:hypothetical protein
LRQQFCEIGINNIKELIRENSDIPSLIWARTSLDIHLLDDIVDDLEEQRTKLYELTSSLLTLEPDPVKYTHDIRANKAQYVYAASVIGAEINSLEKVSPALLVHTGPQIETMRAKIGLTDKSASPYQREFVGLYAGLLSRQLETAIHLPKAYGEAGSAIEVYTSGMGSLSTVLRGIVERYKYDVDICVSSSFYFEVGILADKLTNKNTQEQIDEKFYNKFENQAQKKTAKPLAYFVQPYSSSPSDPVLDIDRMLKTLEDNPVNRPVYIVIDGTMHGATLNYWDRITKLVEQNKNVTLILAESMVKHSQIGIDKTPAGFAAAYGANPKIIEIAASESATILTEAAAVNLYPFDEYSQTERILRAGRNAEWLSGQMKAYLKANPYVNEVYYSLPNSNEPNELISQYKTKPPFFFIKLNHLLQEDQQRTLTGSLPARSLSELAQGTSYGFDESRFEFIPINGDTYLRISAGQESPIQLQATLSTLERSFKTVTDRDWVETAYSDKVHYLAQDISSGHTIDNSAVIPPNEQQNIRSSDIYKARRFDDMSIQLAYQYQIRTVLNEKPKGFEPRYYVESYNESLNALESAKISDSRLEQLTCEWVIAQDYFLEEFQRAMENEISRTQAYTLARMVVALKSMHISLIPVAKKVYECIEKTRPGDMRFSKGNE